MTAAALPVAARIEDTWPQHFSTKEDFREAAGMSWPTVLKFTTLADLPPNHPLVPKIASVLKMSPAALVEDTTAAPLDDGTLRRVTASLGKRKKKPKTKAVARAGKKPGKALVHVPRERTIQAMSKTALRKLNPKALQLARTLVTSTNVQIMQGKSYLSLPNMPVDALAMLLADYLQAKGVPGVMILNPDYAEIFG